MVRRSAFVALLAIAISLLAHLLGVGLTMPNLTNRTAAPSTPDTVELSSAFEDFADTAAAPVQPEDVEPPAPIEELPQEEPPEEEPVDPVEPEEAETPTSDAQVASSNPQDVTAPDTGNLPVVQPRAPETTVIDPVEQQEPTVAESAEVEELPPVEAQEEPAAGTPDATATPVETQTVEAPVAEDTQQLAALPVPVVPVAPTDSQPVEPILPDAAQEPEPDSVAPTETETEETESELAVVSSPRPRLPEDLPEPAPRGAPDGSGNFDNLRFPQQTVESPITTYRREGVDAFQHGSDGSPTGGLGPGNSDTTNYAGRVLVHLNRTPLVYVPTRGFAKVLFQINPDGSLAWVDVIDSSGAPDVERAARQQVRNAAPFPRPPGGVNRKLSFYYRIQ